MGLLCVAATAPLRALGQEVIESITANNTIRIPRVSRPPTIEDFINMKPSPDFADGKMVMIDKLVQREPSDGAAISERTEVYLGYDSKNLYAVFVCFDSNTKGIRAHLGKREDGWGDENAEIMLDTFNDKRRSYGFMSNPLGIQADGIWTESGEWDMSFDTLWYSKGKLTEQGYVVWMQIPFRSLRFPNKPQQRWGLVLDRDIPRKNEEAYWPRYSQKLEGRLSQEGEMVGIENVSPGRNMQFIPYGAFRSYRAPDFRYSPPHFSNKDFKGDLGLDSKIVIKDSFVFDSTVNPDFSQVESDEPQVTTNQRFEVFFPEKRPFFLENADYFKTPINLVFTRRIADPDFGLRLTGKKGPWSVGTLLADDRSPGKSLPENDPLAASRAMFSVVRVNRDIFKQSSIGMIYTDREYEGEYNRVGGIDTRLKLNKNWVFTGQAVTSSTRWSDGSHQAGPSYSAELQRSGRSFEYYGSYSDTGVGFFTQSGFFRRPDIRNVYQQMERTFWPEGRYVISHGFQGNVSRTFDHAGFMVNSWQQAEYYVNFRRQTSLQIGSGFGTEGLRPQDYASLSTTKQYSETDHFVFFRTEAWQKLGFEVNAGRSKAINYNTIGMNDPGGQVPLLGTLKRLDLTATVRPMNQLRIDNTYLYRRLEDPPTGQSAYNLHIIRSKWNYQITKELSVRVIGQYNAQLANPLLTTLKSEKTLNADFLVSYLLHPGTAVYVGYNSNLANLDPSLAVDSNNELIRTRNRFINDGRQFFVKISYLFRY